MPPHYAVRGKTTSDVIENSCSLWFNFVKSTCPGFAIKSSSRTCSLDFEHPVFHELKHKTASS